MRTAHIEGGLRRGVYVAPWMGPGDEIVLIALTSKRHLAGDPVVVPHGDSHVRAADLLWERLDRLDPDRKTRLRAI